MALRISTTSSTVYVNDLGLVLIHPTTDRDISLEFTPIEIQSSSDLTTAIQNGDITVDDGTYHINSLDYDPNEVLNQNLQLKVDRRFVSYDEITAGNLDKPIETGVFPLSLNSTASITRNVYVPAARWGTWQIDADDLVVISGSTAADGTYTVESITDHQNFIVVESISDSTGGTITVYHPNISTLIGVDNTNFTTVSGENLQETLDSIDYELGQNASTDELVKVSNNDTTAGYLYNKIIAGTAILITEINDGGDEDLRITSVESGGAFQIDYSYISQGQPYVSFTANDWATASAFIFRGSNTLGTPTTIKAILECSDTGVIGGIRVVDVTNNNQIVYKEFTNITPAIIDLGSISNVSTSESIWEVQLKRVSSSGNPLLKMYTLSVYF